MSGGQQQMLALARSYITNPGVVLLDEVSMGLAPIIVDEIFEFLERMAAEGTALLLVEQYATKALAIADYAYILGRGAVTFAGDAAELEGEDVFQRYLGIDVAAGVASRSSDTPWKNSGTPAVWTSTWSSTPMTPSSTPRPVIPIWAAP
jgi:ABC-type multidrug transport system ATPase subunit